MHMSPPCIRSKMNEWLLSAICQKHFVRIAFHLKPLYLLCPSNFLIIVSIKVFCGATWPLLTGILVRNVYLDHDIPELSATTKRQHVIHLEIKILLWQLGEGMEQLPRIIPPRKIIVCSSTAFLAFLFHKRLTPGLNIDILCLNFIEWHQICVFIWVVTVHVVEGRTIFLQVPVRSCVKRCAASEATHQSPDSLKVKGLVTTPSSNELQKLSTLFYRSDSFYQD